jgi:hypothetical protein
VRKNIFMGYTLVTLAERPDLLPQLHALEQEAWPTFMRKDPVAAQYWDRLLRSFPHDQLLLCDEQDQIVAAANAIPVGWNGTLADLPAGWDAVLERGIQEYEHGQSPTALSALAILVKPILRGQALSSRMIQALRHIALAQGFPFLIAPVRPSLKHRYSLIRMEDYVSWRREDGLPFDPWIRAHVQLGASVLQVAPQSMVIRGTVKPWEEWTGMRLPQSGLYIIPDALAPLLISSERNEGQYEEPNVWMQHSIHPDEREVAC